MSPKAVRANQEFFDLLVGDIFARLYTFFPEPIDIHSDGIFYNDELKRQERFDDDPERLQMLYGHAVQWLADEGYLRFGQVASQDAAPEPNPETKKKDVVWFALNPDHRRGARRLALKIVA